MRKDKRKRIAGYSVVALFGTILITSLVLPFAPAPNMHMADTMTEVNSPADHYPIEERARLCGTGEASSTPYVQEYRIPTECTNPVAISVDRDGDVWFAQTNTGKLARFDPATSNFTEYTNAIWPPRINSMMWGMDHAPDGSVWFTDDRHNSLWRFSTLDGSYLRYNLSPDSTDILPQTVKISGSQLVFNDFTGNSIGLLDPTQDISGGVSYVAIPPRLVPAVTAAFAIDGGSDLWYTNWQGTQPGILVRFDLAGYQEASAGATGVDVGRFATNYPLPPDMLAPNGIAVSGGLVWLMDTTSSYFFSFDPVLQQFTKYVTAPPQQSAYGNHTGVVLTPVSRPYWAEADDAGRIIFNEQTANNIGVFDPRDESLVEYHVPSKNPFWADCDPGTGMSIEDCGVAQILGMAVDGDRVWFTEWVENNIGVVDTSVPLPFDVGVEPAELALAPGESGEITLTVTSSVSGLVATVADSADASVSASAGASSVALGSGPSDVPVVVSAPAWASPGAYKVLLGAQHPDVAIGKFVTVTVR